MLVPRAWIACEWPAPPIPCLCRFLPEAKRLNRKARPWRPGEAPYGALGKNRRYPRTSSHGRSALAKRNSRSESFLRLGRGRQCPSPSHTNELPGPPRLDEGCSVPETSDTGRPSDRIVARLRKEAPPQEQSFALLVIAPRRLGG